MILQPETIKMGMSTYLVTLKRAWRAVDALGGRCSDPQVQADIDRGLNDACAAIEALIEKQTVRELDAGTWGDK